MAMFEQFFKRGQDKEAQQQKEEMEFNREQNLMNSATHPEDDRTYIDSQERKSDLIRWQQELDQEMYQQVLSFLSLRIDGDGKVVKIFDEKKKPIPPMCNRVFIHQVVEPKLRPFISKNLINSNLDEKRILMMQRNTADDVVDMMADGWDKYAINFTDFDGILRDLKNVMNASIWRAYKGWTKKTDSSMIKRVESENYGRESEQGRGIKGLFHSS